MKENLDQLKSAKRSGLLDESLLKQMIDEHIIDEFEAVELTEYQPSEEFTRLNTRIHEAGTDEEIEQLEVSINLALEFDLITEDEHDDLLDEFEGSFGLRKVVHDGVEMVAMAVPFWNGVETMRGDGCIYTHGGCWLNIETGEMIFERD